MTGISLLLEQDTRDLRELQFRRRSGSLDLTWGHPDPLLLPVEDIRAAYNVILSQNGWLPLSYGYGQGSGALRTAIADDLSAHGVHGVGADSIVITAGSSGALDLYLALYTKPGDVIFVEQPTYFLALKIFRDHDLQVVGLPPSDGHFTAAQLLAATKARTSVASESRAFLYLVPTHCNPTGRTIPESERSEIVEAALRHGITILEDDVYSELGDGAPSPLWTYSPSSVVKIGSFSKTIAPGLRLGYLVTTPSRAQAIAESGLLDSGGGVNPLTAHVVAHLFDTGRYRDIVGRLKDAYRQRMDALYRAVKGVLNPVCKPSGGFFMWCQVPVEMRASDFVIKAASLGVDVADGKHFFASDCPAVHSYVVSHVAFSMKLPCRRLVLGSLR